MEALPSPVTPSATCVSVRALTRYCFGSWNQIFSVSLLTIEGIDWRMMATTTTRTERKRAASPPAAACSGASTQQKRATVSPDDDIGAVATPANEVVICLDVDAVDVNVGCAPPPPLSAAQISPAAAAVPQPTAAAVAPAAAIVVQPTAAQIYAAAAAAAAPVEPAPPPAPMGDDEMQTEGGWRVDRADEGAGAGGGHADDDSTDDGTLALCMPSRYTTRFSCGCSCVL
jgi:hypothetical protein